MQRVDQDIFIVCLMKREKLCLLLLLRMGSFSVVAVWSEACFQYGSQYYNPSFLNPCTVSPSFLQDSIKFAVEFFTLLSQPSALKSSPVQSQIATTSSYIENQLHFIVFLFFKRTSLFSVSENYYGRNWKESNILPVSKTAY